MIAILGEARTLVEAVKRLDGVQEPEAHLVRAAMGDKETRVFLRADKSVDYGALIGLEGQR